MKKRIQLMLSEMSRVIDMQFECRRCNDSTLVISTERSALLPKIASSLPELDSTCVAMGHTAYEAFCNHYHLYMGKIKDSELMTIRQLSLAIGRSVYERLTLSYPNYKFRLYLEINKKEGIALRFHQVWENEMPIYDDATIAASKLSKEFQIYLLTDTKCDY
mgnify:FL=1